MDKKLKAKWVKALRSGRYEQSSAYLMDGHGGYCCLGVLCKVAGARSEEICTVGYPSETKRFDNLIDDVVARKLARLNDNGVPFEMIAGLIHEAL